MERKVFYVDFQGWCEIEATSVEEANEKFWEYINTNQALPSNVYSIEDMEEKKA